MKEINYSEMYSILKEADSDIVAIRYGRDGVKKDSEIIHSIADLETWESTKFNVWDIDRYYTTTERKETIKKYIREQE